MRRLVSNVNIDGRWYGPAYPDVEVPPEVAAKLDNPDMWEGEEDEAPKDARPSRNDPKAAWVDYAVSQGKDRDEAEAQSKQALLDEFGG